jgi:hypothetical protein
MRSSFYWDFRQRTYPSSRVKQSKKIAEDIWYAIIKGMVWVVMVLSVMLANRVDAA